MPTSALRREANDRSAPLRSTCSRSMFDRSTLVRSSCTPPSRDLSRRASTVSTVLTSSGSCTLPPDLRQGLLHRRLRGLRQHAHAIHSFIYPTALFRGLGEH